MPTLEAAVKSAVSATGAGDLTAALETLIAAWREQPVVALANAIAALGAALAAKDDSLAGKTTEVCAAWREAATAQQAKDLDRLLSSWLDVPKKLAVERVDLLAAWPPDPRRDRALAEVLERIPYKTTRKFWGRLLAMIASVRDPSVLPRLSGLEKIFYDEWIADTGYWAQEKLAAIMATVGPELADIEAQLPALPDAAAAALAEIHRTLAPTGDAAQSARDEDALLDQVLATPDDDDARRVYGDLLAKRGHPRAELISLQFLALTSRLSAEQRKREKALIKDNLEQLAGPLSQVLRRGGLVFERGFLSACVVDREKEHAIAQVVGHPLWSTVQDLDGPMDIAEHPVMRSLTTLRVLASSDTPRLWDDGAPFQHVRALHCWSYAGEDLAALGATKRFPALESLHLTWVNPSGGATDGDPSPLLGTPLMQRLQRLEVNPREWRPWYEALCASECPTPTVALIWRRVYELHFARDEQGRHSRLTLRFKLATDKIRPSVEERALDELASLLRGLDPGQLTALELAPARKLSAAARERLDRELAPFAAVIDA